MKKKVIFTMLLCILALSCAYAGKTSFVAQISPYSLQTVSLSGNTQVSSYGYGFKGGLRYDVRSDINLGFDVELGVFKYDGLESDLDTVSFRLLFGYRYTFNPSIYLQSEFGLSLDKKQTSEASIKSVGLNMYLGCGYVISEQLTATVGTDIGAGFQKNHNDIASSFLLRTKLGVVVAL